MGPCFYYLQNSVAFRPNKEESTVGGSVEMQARFMAEISIFDPQMLIWVDETGSACKDLWIQPEGDA